MPSSCFLPASSAFSVRSETDWAGCGLCAVAESQSLNAPIVRRCGTLDWTIAEMNIYTPFLKFFRPRRLHAFYRLLSVNESTRVLDIGGGAFFWDLALSEGLPLPQVTVLNIRPAGDDARSFLRWIVADARASQLPDNSFDLVFSNSLVEHLGDFKSQKLFADEVRRLAPRFFVQTPDRLCPVEPHFVTPFIHWLPRDVQRRLIRNFTVWGLGARPSQSCCDHLSEEIALLSKREMKQLFPDATVLSERFAGVPKSLIAVKTGTPVPSPSVAVDSVVSIDSPGT
jgi:SAM-dependent methyltransferase